MTDSHKRTGVLNESGQCRDGTDRYDPHADDFCVVCGRHPEPGLTMHPVASIENGTVCEVCTHAI